MTPPPTKYADNYLIMESVLFVPLIDEIEHEQNGLFGQSVGQALDVVVDLLEQSVFGTLAVLTNVQI